MEKFGLNAKEGNKGNNPSNKYGTNQCEPCENENFAKSFFLKSLPTRPSKFNSVTTKDYYASIFNNKRNKENCEFNWALMF